MKKIIIVLIIISALIYLGFRYSSAHIARIATYPPSLQPRVANWLTDYSVYYCPDTHHFQVWFLPDSQQFREKMKTFWNSAAAEAWRTNEAIRMADWDAHNTNNIFTDDPSNPPPCGINID